MANYLLLRDNKESGPFSAEDLVKMGLKAYDLVWVQGKSAAWRYPSEVPELKPYAPEVEEQPFDRFFKKPAASATEEKAAAKEDIAKTSIPEEYQAYIPKVKTDEQPAVKRKVFVTMPGQVTEKKIAAVKPATAPKPAPVPIPDYTQPEAEETISITENPVAKIKYSQPLDEIKEMYVKTLRDRKDRLARKSFLQISLRRAAVVVGLIGIGVLAGFILRSKPAANSQLAQQLPATNTLAASNTPEEPQQPPVEQSADPQPETVPAEQSLTSPEPTTPSPKKQEVVADQQFRQPVETGRDAVRKTPSQETSDASQQSIKEERKPLAVMPRAEISKQGSPEYSSAETNPVTGERSRTVRSSAPTAADQPRNETAGNSPARTASAPENALSGLGDKVSVTSNDYKRVALGGIRNLELTVRNQSKYDLDEVAVELQYLKPGDQVLKTQTIQFKSVPANESETLRIPDTNRGVKVQFRIVRIGSSQLVNR